MDNKKIELLQKLIDESHHIVFFGGAGVSTESGIPDFRSKDGLYRLHSKYDRPYEEMLSHTYFMNETSTFYKFYKEFMITDAKPNKAHYFLAELEKKKDLTVITQNIDGLHQIAGSKKVIELHGSIHRNYCMNCYRFYSLKDMLALKGDIPRCESCGGIIKPDVVLYEEGLNEDDIQNAIRAIQKADLFIVAGTSLKVYPANGLIYYYQGKNNVVINKEPLNISSEVTLEINDPVGEVLSQIKI